MKSITLLICVMVAVVLLTGAEAQLASKRCTRNSQCSTGCCISNLCTDGRWCPCSFVNGNPCGPNQRCESQEVQCVRAPCYPVRNCIDV